jgi:queuosine precursor transporter
MNNELLFCIHTIIIALSTLFALKLGKEALVTFICAYCLFANVFVLKQITLFGFQATASDAFTIGATLGLNLLQEYFGRSIAYKTIGINFFLLLFYTIISQIHLFYAPALTDYMQPFYVGIFQVMPRIAIASFTVYLITQTIDYYLYAWLKSWWHARALVVRNYISIIISQFIDTVLFTIFGLYGIIDNIVHVIFISYAIKLAAILIAIPFVGISQYVMNDKNNV